MVPETFISSLELNDVSITRTRLTPNEAIAVWLMKWSGDRHDIIAAKLGINQGRIAEVLMEQKHIGSRVAAFRLKSG